MTHPTPAPKRECQTPETYYEYGQASERILTVLCFADFELEAFDDVARNLPDHARVIDDQAEFHAPKIPFVFIVSLCRTTQG